MPLNLSMFSLRLEFQQLTMVYTGSKVNTKMSNELNLENFKMIRKRKLNDDQQVTKKDNAAPEATEINNKEPVPEKSSSKKVKVPPHWEDVLDNLREMRKEKNAPVDSMGCGSCQDNNAAPEVKRYQTLLSLMLSSQTKDEITYAAMEKLKDHGCTVDSILNSSDEKLGELIYPASFWKTKVKHIKKTTQMIKDDFNGDIPKTVKELCKLPGVGPKMAHICMSEAWGELTGIGVDTHVHRISNRLGWVKTKNPNQTQKDLEDWLPKEIWSEVNELLVGFGQQTCKALKPNCDKCLNKLLCPFGIQNLKSTKKSK